MTYRRARRAAWSALLILAGSCCTKPELDMGSMGGRLDLGFDLAFEADFDAEMSIDFDGDLSLWCDIDAATQANFGFEFTGMAAYTQTLQADVDGDGVAEVVNLLAFGEDPDSPQRTFAAWTGDAYTYDEGRCYLLWWEGETVELLSATCGRAEPALHCESTRDQSEAADCDVCDASGACASCDEEKVSACVDEGARTLDTLPPGTGGTGGTSSGGGAAGLGAAAGAPVGGSGGDTGGTGGVVVETGGSGGSGGSITIDFDTCVAEAAAIAGHASSCSMGPLRDTADLCANRVSDVNICYVAVEGAAVFGSECSALDSAVCAGVFP